jgi:hypothetical protein
MLARNSGNSPGRVRPATKSQRIPPTKRLASTRDRAAGEFTVLTEVRTSSNYCAAASCLKLGATLLTG